MRKFVAPRPRPTGTPKSPAKQFDRFQATELYCPKCRKSMPVRERLLLVLPEGDKYEYLCAYCGTSVGERLVKGEREPIIIVS
jgi:hypothetical protein